VSLREPILVVGGYGYRNLGDEAILAGLLRWLGPDRAVTVVSRAPAETTALHQVPSVPIRRALLELAGHRTLLIGGGGLFGPDMGVIGRLLPYFGLFASSLGRDVAIHGVGVNDDLAPSAGRVLRWVASRSVELSVRDAASRDRVGVDPARVSVHPDLSSWVTPAEPDAAEAFLRDAGLDPSRRIVGLALSGVNGHLREPVLDAVAAAMRGMPRTQFCFVPMSRHPFVREHDDMLLGRALQRREPRLVVLTAEMSPPMAIAIFARFGAAVCMRYHSLLFAARGGVPIAAIPYARKCDDWLREAGIAPVPLVGGALEARLRGLLRQKRAA
jgi:polysaccharide pyruvyl transferase WcaK-like protein